MNTPEQQKRDEDWSWLSGQVVGGESLPPAPDSDAMWKTLALRLTDQAQTCLDNAHWEVKFGSGDLLATIKAIRLKAELEAIKHHNSTPRHHAGQ